jgi:hypothetical protein
VLNIHHNVSRKGKVYANILHPILPAPEDTPFIRIPKNWTAPKFTKRGGSLAGSRQDGAIWTPAQAGAPKKEVRPAAAPQKQETPEVLFEANDEDVPF